MNCGGNESDGLNAAKSWHEPERDDPVLQSALQDFRASVHAWSEDAYHRPRAATVSSQRPLLWRKATVWSAGVLVAAGLAVAGAFEHHQHQLKVEAQVRHQIELQKQEEAQRARENADLLARIDSDVSRQVPSAMDPLANLMTDDQTQ